MSVGSQFNVDKRYHEAEALKVVEIERMAEAASNSSCNTYLVI
jgi:hypothetical protein